MRLREFLSPPRPPKLALSSPEGGVAGQFRSRRRPRINRGPFWAPFPHLSLHSVSEPWVSAVRQSSRSPFCFPTSGARLRKFRIVLLIYVFQNARGGRHCV